MKILKLAVALVLIISLVSVLRPGRSLASTGVIYISPSSGSVQINDDITVGLRINPGTSVNAVQATVNYNASDLQFVSDSLSAFPVCTQNTGGGGSVALACAQLSSSTSSDSLIANITFQALVGSGSTSLSISGAEAANNGSYTDPSVAGSTMSFTSPASTPPPSTPKKSSSSSGSSSNSTTNLGPSKPASNSVPTTTVAPPKITISSRVSSLQLTTALVDISTNLPVNTIVQYGTSETDLNSSTSLTTTPSSSSSTLLSSLTPGTTYYYRVVATDSSGNLTDGTTNSFTTKGYTVSVTVLDSNDHPLANKIVTLHSTPMTAETNSQGVATFTNVAPGTHHVEYTAGGHTYTEPLFVANSAASSSSSTSTSSKNGSSSPTQTATPQSDAVILSGYKQPSPTYLLFAIMCLLAIGILLVLTKLASRFRIVQRNGQPLHFHPSLHHKPTV